MKLSLNWLKDYIDIDISPQKLAEKLTLSGTAVDGFESLGDDIIFDLDLTPNRGDCFSVLGIAREVAALLKLKVKRSHYAKASVGRQISSNDLEVNVTDKKLCPKYCALIIKNIKVGESPEWLKKRLLAVGFRPINNIVDITNYVMMELGQPLHAFDKLKVQSAKCKVTIGVRRAQKGEKIITLDNQKRKLCEKMLVITDSERPIALAGVMGGADTEVTKKTKDIILEAAIFNPASIRHTYRKTALRTEAAIRFEKGVDWFLPERALARAGEIIAKVAGGKVAGNIVKLAQPNPKLIKFEVKIDYVNKLLGHKFGFKQIKNILERLGIAIYEVGCGLHARTPKKSDASKRVKTKSPSPTKGYFTVHIPSWRHDLKIPADIAEEIGRIYDYNSLKPVPIKADICLPEDSAFYNFKRQIKDILKSLGYNEIYTYSFYSDKEARFVTNSPHVEILNPTSTDQRYLRHSLLPLLLQKASINLRFFDDIKIFELGTIFKNADESILPKEEIFLAGAIACKNQNNYQLYRRLKGDIEVLLKNLGIKEEVSFEKEGSYIDINYQDDNQWLGQIYILEKYYKEDYKIRQNLLLFQFNVAMLRSLFTEQKSYTAISEFPSVIRDLSFIVPSGLKYQNLVEEITAVSPYIQNIKLIDEYILPNKGRSLTLRITYRSLEKTLESREVEKVEKEMIEELRCGLGVELRK
jgi:phenylalanyl-tRNA synthetase beta chain